MLHWARTDLEQRQGARFEMLVKIAQVRTVKGEIGEARTSSSNEYSTCDLTCQNQRMTWFTNSSRTQYPASLRDM